MSVSLFDEGLVYKILGYRDPRFKHEYLDKCENTEESQ